MRAAAECCAKAVGERDVRRDAVGKVKLVVDHVSLIVPMRADLPVARLDGRVDMSAKVSPDSVEV